MLGPKGRTKYQFSCTLLPHCAACEVPFRHWAFRCPSVSRAGQYRQIESSLSSTPPGGLHFTNWKRVKRRHCPQAARELLESQKAIPQRRSLLDGLIDRCPPLGSPEVLKRAAVTLGFIALVRLGAQIPLYGVDLSKVPINPRGEEQLILEPLSSVPANIFMLGISPMFFGGVYVTLSSMFPELFGTKRKQGLEGRADAALKQRLVACAAAVFMGAMRAFQLQKFVAPTARGFVQSTVLTLAAGAVVLNHVADENEARGLGSGFSLLIALPMLLRQAKTLQAALFAVVTGFIPPWKAALAAAGIVALVYASILVSLTEKRYELISYKIDVLPEHSSFGRSGRHRNFLPLRIAPSGVSCLLMSGFYLHTGLSLVTLLSKPAGLALQSFLYRPAVMPLALAAIAFLSVFADFSFGKHTRDIGLWMQQSDVGVKQTPPLVPGEATTSFLMRQQSLAHFWGGLAVAALACLAHGLDVACQAWTGVSFGAVTMLLLTGFITTAHRQVEALSELPKLERRIQSEQRLLQSYAD